MANELDKTPETGEETTFAKVMWWLKPILITVAVALVVRALVMEPFTVPTGSMEETIMSGEVVVTEKLSYRFGSPKAGDVVVFVTPEDDQTILVKRVIATGGQTVDLVGGKVVVDGVELDEPYTLGKPSEPLARTLPGADVSFPYTVPEGYVWVMGDNRTNSSDSRYFGAIEESRVFGRGFGVVWPLTHWHTI